MQNSNTTWQGGAGAGALDLRSDTQTTPTAAMLSAVAVTTLDDDVYGEDQTTIDLEAHVAALAGKEAALFVLSGTMGNQLALRSLLTRPPHGVLCDHRSHIYKYEAGGYSASPPSPAPACPLILFVPGLLRFPRRKSRPSLRAMAFT